MDKFPLVSNSDYHSPYPHRLGREANVFEVEKLTYDSVINAIRGKKSICFENDHRSSVRMRLSIIIRDIGKIEDI